MVALHVNLISPIKKYIILVNKITKAMHFSNFLYQPIHFPAINGSESVEVLDDKKSSFYLSNELPAIYV